MDFQLPCKDSKEIYNQVKKSVMSIQNSGHRHVTVIWPSSTSAIFMRRRLMKDLNGAFAIKNTSVREVQSLVDSLKNPNSIYHPAKTLKQWELLAEISQEIFGQVSWRRIQHIDDTLEIVCNLEDAELSDIKHYSPLAYSCYKKYQELSKFKKNDQLAINKKQLELILGKCVLISPEYSTRAIKNLKKDISVCIDKEIIYKNAEIKSRSIPTDLYQSPLDEMESVLVRISESAGLSDLNSVAVIVPNMAYKRFFISNAKSRGIPVAGNSATTLANNEIVQFFKFVLENHQDTIDLERSLDRFTWLKSKDYFLLKNGFEKLIAQLISEKQATLKTKLIFEFIKNYIDQAYFETTQNEAENAQKAFELIKDLSEIKLHTNVEDIVYLVDLITEVPLRENTIGEGIYVSLPDELEGSHFDSVFVLGISDKFFQSVKPKVSLINDDQYLSIGVEDQGALIAISKNKLSWLLNCSDEINYSTSAYGMDAKKITQPIWSDPRTVKDHHTFEYPLVEIDLDECENHLSSSLGQLPNPINTSLSDLTISSISATGIETLATCPYKFFYRNILKLRSEPINTDPDYLNKLDSGNLIHQLLEQYTNENLSNEEVYDILKRRVSELHEEQVLPTLASKEMNYLSLSKYLDTFFELLEQAQVRESQAEIEVSGQLKIEDISLNVKGKIDRLDFDDSNKVALIDYKTGSTKNNSSVDFYNYGRRIQLAIYAQLLSNSHDIRALEYWYLKPDEKTKDIQSVTPSKLAELKQTLISILSIIKTLNFPAREVSFIATKDGDREENNCEKCEFEGICFNENKSMWQTIKKETPYVNYSSAVGENSDEVLS